MVNKTAVYWIIVAFVVIALVALIGFYHGATVSIAVSSVIIATVSTIFASRSLILANESLILTRNKVRPFIYVQSGDQQVSISPKEIILTFEFVNAGILPGEILSVETQFFVENEDITIDNHSSYFPAFSKLPSQPIIFPNSKNNIVHTIDLSDELCQRMWDVIHSGKSKVRFRTKYKDKDNEYITIQTEQISESKNSGLTRHPISPQYWT